MPQPPSDDEIQARLRQAAERARQSPDLDEAALLRKIEEEKFTRPKEPERVGIGAPEGDPEFAERVQRLDDKVAQLRGLREEKARQAKKVERQAHADAGQLGSGLAIAYSFLGLPAIGLLVGWGLSRVFQMPVLTSACGFVGILAGCVMAFWLLRQANKAP